MGCDIHMRVEFKRDDQWIPATLPDGIDDRNYNLFAVLADVRHGTWSEPLPCIDEPRGLPDGYEEDAFGDHSFSHVTLRELLEYDWEGTVKCNGMVSADYVHDGVTPPQEYAAASNHGKRIYWEETVRSFTREWPTRYLPKLAELGAPDAVRIVFGFDS
jgi:hypothetical protein